MTTSALIGSSVFSDLLSNSPFFGASRDTLFRRMLEGPLVLGAVVWAELSHTVSSEVHRLSRLRWLGLQEADFLFKVAFWAGRAHRLYREGGGWRERTLPDFLIGAHAMVAGHRLWTRDPARYRSCFPNLDIVPLETRP